MKESSGDFALRERLLIQYGISLEWQEKLIIASRKAFLSFNGLIQFIELYFSILNCGDLYRELRNWDKSEKKYIEVIDLLRCPPSNMNADMHARFCSCVHNRLALLYSNIGDWERAKEHNKKEIELEITKLQAKEMWAPYHTRGNILLESGDLEAAKHSYIKAIESAKKETTDDMRIQDMLTISYGALGKVAHESLLHKEAKQYYEDALSNFILPNLSISSVLIIVS